MKYSIAVEGPIGVGKSTLATALSDYYKTDVLYEIVEENPFLADFYKDKERLALQTEMYFLLSRYEQMRKLGTNAVYMSDYHIVKNYIFAEMNLDEASFQIFEETYKAVIDKIELPKMIVYLDAPIDVLISRIMQRNRTFETDMDAAYLERLLLKYREYLPKFVKAYNIPYLHIDASKIDYRDIDSDGFAYIIEKIEKVVNSNER